MANKKSTVVEQVETALEEVVETPEIVVEQDEIPAEPPIPPLPAPVSIITVRDGDSYASLAAEHAPKDGNVHAYARELYALNNGAVVRHGARIKIK